MHRILLTHTDAELALYYGDTALAGLGQVGEVRRIAGADSGDVDQVIAAAGDCDVVVSYRASAAPARLFEALPQLSAFVRCAVDIRNIDLAAASRCGVLVTQASAGFSAAVAEWVIGAMIDLSRGLSNATEAYRRGRSPAIVLGRELRGATLGLVGYGRIARHLAPIARAIGMRVLACDPHQPPDDGVAQPATFEEVLRAADYLVCLAVATPETADLMNARAFAQMRPGACFVNPSRGDLVDEAALRAALDAGHLAGCAMDVGRAPDQMPSPALAAHPRVVATPHIGGLTRPAIEHQSLETVAQVAALLRGEAPVGAVNAAQAARWRARYGVPGSGNSTSSGA